MSIPGDAPAPAGAGTPSKVVARARSVTIPIGAEMSSAIIMQYMGFEAKPLTREYTFNVREAGQEREFRLNIANEAFVSHRASYQDAPGICSQRLQVELATYSNHPPETEYEITGAELDSYRQARLPKKTWGKPQENF